MSGRFGPVERVDGASDASAFLTLNNAADPAVNALSPTEFSALLAMGTLRGIRDDEGRPAAVLLTMRDGQPYDQSLNYQWFTARYDRFLYVDRIVVAPWGQGGGLGRRLYEAARAEALEAGLPRMCAEVNVRPPNPGSLAFHERMGFRVLEERDNAASGKRVAMMLWEPLSAEAERPREIAKASVGG